MFNKDRKNKEKMKNIISTYLLYNMSKLKRLEKVCFIEGNSAIKFDTNDMYQPLITNVRTDKNGFIVDNFHITICLNTLYLAYLESLDGLEDFTLNFVVKLVNEIESGSFDISKFYFPVYGELTKGGI